MLKSALTEHWRLQTDSIQNEVSPLLFGHNLEHTRSSIWQGLSAQIIRNRKFAGKPHRTGQAIEWHRFGHPRALFFLDPHDTYTRHVRSEGNQSRRRNELHSQKMQNYFPGELCGLVQKGLPLSKDLSYEGRIVLKASQRLSVTILLTNADGQKTYSVSSVEAQQDNWSSCTFSFRAPETDPEACLQITFSDVGELAIGSVSLLPSNHFLGMRPDVIQLLKQMGTTMLRWPGGNFAGDYRWEDGLLEVDQRGPLGSFTEVETLPHTFGFDCHEIGIDEFIHLCRELEAEPFISINISWDTPIQSAEWIAYCNGSSNTQWGRIRIERGYSEPYKVKYWSLGNELGYGHMEGPNTPEAYAERAALFADEMKKIDPSIILVSSGIWWDDAWFSDCLKSLSSKVDMISEHLYATDRLEDRNLPLFDPNKAKQYFHSLVEIANEQIGKLRTIRQKIQHVVPEGKRVSISFDEWNVWYAWYRTPGVSEGMYAASMLHLLCREAGRLDIACSCYFEPVNEGAIIVDPYGSRLTPVGQVFNVMKAHRANHIIETACGSLNPHTDVTASTNLQSGDMIVTILNQSAEEDVIMSLQLDGANFFNLFESILLSSADFLPGSIFEQSELQISSINARNLTFTIPKHSIAELRFTTA
jgi:alpha-L-arabinofuranosidase